MGAANNEDASHPTMIPDPTDNRCDLATRFGIAALIAATVAMLGLIAGCTSPGTTAGTKFWAVSSDRDLSIETAPNPENEIYSASRGEVTISAAINETVAFQIGLRNDSASAGPLDITITDLIGSAGKFSSSAVVRMYRAHDVTVETFGAWYPQRTGRQTTPIAVPDILVPWGAPRGGGPIRLSRSKGEIVWVDLAVPSDANPGAYVGRIELRGGVRREPIYSCKLKLNVAPVRIPAEPALPLLCRIDPSDLLERMVGWPASSPEGLRLVPSDANHRSAVHVLNAAMQLFHQNRATPLLWAAFPKYRLTDEYTAEIEWENYDQLVSPWLSGDAFDDGVGLTRWIFPAGEDYPDATLNGGFESARYARLLGAYLRECRRHFSENGWLDRSFLSALPPARMSKETIDRLRRTVSIVRQSEANAPVAAHLPVRSLDSFGWQDAPKIDAPGTAIWAPPADWYEPEMLRRERDLGRHAWFVPSTPPYSGSLAVEAPVSDTHILAWQAFRYGAEAIWVEHAADIGRGASAAASDSLIYSGEDYGLNDTPIPSMRLKRLRRGLYDYDLLTLLKKSGKPLLATRTAEQMARWAFTDACAENLLSTRDIGWPDNPHVLWLARQLVLQELSNEAEPTSAGGAQQDRNLAQWSTLLNQTDLIRAQVRGARLEDPQHAHIYTAIDNGSPRSLSGVWHIPTPPEGWTIARPPTVSTNSGGRATSEIDVTLSGVTYNEDGVYPFNLSLQTGSAGDLSAPGRLAVAACPLIDRPLEIDGVLSDWDVAYNNVAGDFLLVRGDGVDGTQRPELSTQAFFCMDRDHLYVAIRCRTKRGERPLWRADNVVPIDGAIPWGQDVVEVLLDPYNTVHGAADGIYCLQVKPSGLLTARIGCLTDPPMNKSTPWESGARAAVLRESDAWTVELALPLSSLGKSAARNRVWGFNITRLDARRGEYSSWSGARGNAYATDLLGNLVLLRP